jgi:hypothetical protein
VPHPLRADPAGQVVRQPGPRGEAAHNPPYVGGEQPPAGPGGEEHIGVSGGIGTLGRLIRERIRGAVS